jgi:hypothetical protein
MVKEVAVLTAQQRSKSRTIACTTSRAASSTWVGRGGLLRVIYAFKAAPVWAPPRRRQHGLLQDGGGVDSSKAVLARAPPRRRRLLQGGVGVGFSKEASAWAPPKQRRHAPTTAGSNLGLTGLDLGPKDFFSELIFGAG